MIPWSEDRRSGCDLDFARVRIRTIGNASRFAITFNRAQKWNQRYRAQGGGDLALWELDGGESPALMGQELEIDDDGWRIGGGWRCVYPKKIDFDWG